MEINKNHSLKIEYGQGLTATAVEDLISFNENEIKISLVGKNRVVVLGEKLTVGGFNKQSGELRVCGNIHSVKYLSAHLSPVKRLFK